MCPRLLPDVMLPEGTTAYRGGRLSVDVHPLGLEGPGAL